MAEPPDMPIPRGDLSTDNGSGNYVSNFLKHAKVRPPVTWSNWWKEVKWGRFLYIVITPPFVALFAYFTPLKRETAIWSAIFYVMGMISITGGYHRLWTHRAYNASFTLEVIYAFVSGSTIMGPIIWFARLHRAHHRYTDTPLDPYNAKLGLFWTHLGWAIFKPRCNYGRVDLSDLLNNPVVMWQLRYYPWLILVTAVIFPTAVAGLGWGDWQGGFVYSSLVRIFLVQQSAACGNSIAHWIGDAPYSDKLTPRDHLVTSIITFGDGYHNFHHEFPMDYRSAVKWYQYDPTKWFIWLCAEVGLASHLKKVSENEVVKGNLTARLQELRKLQDAVTWPRPDNSLPVLSWANYKAEAESRALICVAGFIHDVEDFLDFHPGGRQHLANYVGKDATEAFFGGVYVHSNAAHNLLAMKRVGIVRGGVPRISEDKFIPPSERLRVVHKRELKETTELITYSMHSPIVK